MGIIVHSKLLRKLSQTLVASAALGATAGHVLAADEAFRNRQTDFLRRQDPDRVRIDRPQSAPITKIDGIDTPSAETGTETGKPQRASLSVSLSELAAAVDKSKKK